MLEGLIGFSALQAKQLKHGVITDATVKDALLKVSVTTRTSTTAFTYT